MNGDVTNISLSYTATGATGIELGPLDILALSASLTLYPQSNDFTLQGNIILTVGPQITLGGSSCNVAEVLGSVTINNSSLIATAVGYFRHQHLAQRFTTAETLEHLLDEMSAASFSTTVTNDSEPGPNSTWNDPFSGQQVTVRALGDAAGMFTADWSSGTYKLDAGLYLLNSGIILSGTIEFDAQGDVAFQEQATVNLSNVLPSWLTFWIPSGDLSITGTVAFLYQPNPGGSPNGFIAAWESTSDGSQTSDKGLEYDFQTGWQVLGTDGVKALQNSLANWNNTPPTVTTDWNLQVGPGPTSTTPPPNVNSLTLSTAPNNAYVYLAVTPLAGADLDGFSWYLQVNNIANYQSEPPFWSISMAGR